MTYENKFPDWEQRVIAASESTKSASEAAAILGVKYDTYKKYAIKYGCFNTNQSGKGIKGEPSRYKIPIEEILEGLHPQYPTYKLKLRLYKEGYKMPVCECCGLGDSWNNKPISLHLDHIDGVSSNHLLNNLQILCPNCHSQTDTYCGKNKGI